MIVECFNASWWFIKIFTVFGKWVENNKFLFDSFIYIYIYICVCVCVCVKYLQFFHLK